jgi:hypothetical protein
VTCPLHLFHLCAPPWQALTLLFDASYSAVQLENIRVTSPTTIEADWRLGGYLRFPWHPRVEPFKGAIFC